MNDWSIEGSELRGTLVQSEVDQFFFFLRCPAGGSGGGHSWEQDLRPAGHQTLG